MKISISEIVNLINDDLFLPSIQREFVWLNNRKEGRIQKLFDSLMQGYPIGNIMIWRVKKSQGDDLTFTTYKFIENYNENTSNEEVRLNGIKNPGLILDGQQRLTALLIGLKGSYSFNHYNQLKNARLYLNLFGNLEDQEDNTYGLKYEFDFLTQKDVIFSQTNEGIQKLWFSVGNVLDFSEQTPESFKNKYESIIANHTDDSDLKNRALTNLGELHYAICNNEIEVVEIKDRSNNQAENIDRVLNIFVRANDGGVKLEKSDLLLSFMESHRDLFEPYGARKEILEFVDNLNEVELSKPNYGFTKDDVLKACLVISGLDIKYKIANFTSSNLKTISLRWSDIKRALTLTVKLLAKYRFTPKNITSKNALLPIAYFIYTNNLQNTFIDSTNEQNTKLREELVTWLIKAMITGLFGSSSDSTLEKSRKSIDDKNQLPRVDSIDKEAITELVEREKYCSTYSDLILKLITPINHWTDYQQDHLHPQSQFNKSVFQSLKLDDEQTNQFKKKMNSLGNICLLHPTVNITKSDSPLTTWIANQNQELRNSLMLPDEVSLSFKDFIVFVTKREELIINKLNKIIGSESK